MQADASYRKTFLISMLVVFLTQAYMAIFMLYPSVLRSQDFLWEYPGGL